MGPKRACCDLCQSVCLLYFPQEFYTALTPVRMFKLFGIILLYGVREHPHFVLLFIVSGSCMLSSTVAGPTFHRQRHWRTVPFFFFCLGSGYPSCTAWKTIKWRFYFKFGPHTIASVTGGRFPFLHPLSSVDSLQRF